MAGKQKEILVISYLNLRGQTGLPVEKQFQVENFLKENNCDILHLQEAQIDENTFESSICGPVLWKLGWAGGGN